MFYLLLVAGLSFARYVFSVLLEFFVRLDFALSAPVLSYLAILDDLRASLLPSAGDPFLAQK